MRNSECHAKGGGIIKQILEERFRRRTENLISFSVLLIEKNGRWIVGRFNIE